MDYWHRAMARFIVYWFIRHCRWSAAGSMTVSGVLVIFVVGQYDRNLG